MHCMTNESFFLRRNSMVCILSSPQHPPTYHSCLMTIHIMMVPRTLATAVLLQLVCSVVTLATPSSSNEGQREVYLNTLHGGGCQPHHVHLSLGRTQNATHSSMTVSFSLSPVCVVDETVGGAVCVGEHIIEGDAAHDVKSYNAS